MPNPPLTTGRKYQAVKVENPISHSSEYIPPTVIDFGTVRDLTTGSSSSGSADANSQYYWR
jgi:hypothetical protein